MLAKLCGRLWLCIPENGKSCSRGTGSIDIDLTAPFWGVLRGNEKVVRCLPSQAGLVNIEMPMNGRHLAISRGL